MESPEQLFPDCGYSSVFHLLIPRMDKLRVLVELDGEKVRLPRCAPPREFGSKLPLVDTWSGDTETLCLWIERRFDTAPYLRKMLCENSNPRGIEEAIIVVDFIKHDFSATEPHKLEGLVWLPRDMVTKKQWLSPYKGCDVRRIVSSFMYSTVDDRTLAPWRKRGWISETIKICSELLGQKKYPVTNLKQVRNTFHSTVFSCKIPGVGYAYLKCSLRCLHESQSTDIIARLLQQFTPNVVASRKNTFLQLEAPGDYFDLRPDIVMRSLADMHLASLNHIDVLKKAGIRDCSLSWLAENVSSLFNNEILQKNYPRHEGRLALLQRTDEIIQLCQSLLQLGIPHTLIHGDLDISNIKCDAESDEPRVRFIDWANCSISHPFYDYVYITSVGRECVRSEYAKTLYLSRWQHIRPMSDLRKAVYYAAPLMRCNALFDLLRLFEYLEPSDERSLLKKLPNAFDSINRHLDNVKYLQ